MIANPTRDESLFEILARLARRSGDGELVLATLVGLGGALVVSLLLRRPAWVGIALLLAIGAFGGWGISDRELRERTKGDAPPTGAVRALVALRFVCGATSGLLCLVLAARIASLIIGKWGGGM